MAEARLLVIHSYCSLMQSLQKEIVKALRSAHRRALLKGLERRLRGLEVIPGVLEALS